MANGIKGKDQNIQKPVVRSVVKAMGILDCFTPHDDLLSLDQLSKRTGMPKSTLSNLLLTLEQTGYIRKGNLRGTFQLGHKSLEIAYTTLSACGILSIASPILEEIMQDTNEIVYLTTHVNGLVLYLQCFYPGKRVITYSVTGKTNPMYCTGCGKAILSSMTDKQISKILDRHPPQKRTNHTITDIPKIYDEINSIRTKGYAIDNEEDCPGVRCIGIAITDNSNNEVCGSISISGSTLSMTDARMPELAATLSRASMNLKPYAHLFPYKYLE